jgi:hypothetical protein
MTYSRKPAAFLYYGQEPPNPDAALNEAFLAGKKAEHKERSAKGGKKRAKDSRRADWIRYGGNDLLTRIRRMTQ